MNDNQLYINLLKPLTFDHTNEEINKQVFYQHEAFFKTAFHFGQNKASLYFKWLLEAKNIADHMAETEICHWTGIYFCDEKNPKQLWLGPYIGEYTDHRTIAIDQGICGLAVHTNSTQNIDNVKEHPQYLSCSFKTKSEIVIPFYDKNNKVVGELDIDSHNPSAFTKKIEKALEEHCNAFSEIF